jgi:hypothetical protein
MRFHKAFFSQYDLEFIPFAVTGTGTAAITFGSSDLDLTDNGTGDYTLTLKGGRAAGVVLWALAIGRHDTNNMVCTIDDANSTASAVNLRFATHAGSATDCKFSGLIIVKRGAREI